MAKTLTIKNLPDALHARLSAICALRQSLGTAHFEVADIQAFKTEGRP